MDDGKPMYEIPALENSRKLWSYRIDVLAFCAKEITEMQKVMKAKEELKVYGAELEKIAKKQNVI